MARQKRMITIVSIIIVLSVLTLVFVYRFGLILNTSGSLARTAEDTYHIIASYTQKNSGKFPMSEDDLIRQGLLKKIKADDNYEYYLKLGSDDRPDKGYYKCPNFKLLKISYGVKLEDIDRVGLKLYDKSTGEQILLIDGPYRRNLKTTQYEPISLRWYELMVKEQQKLKDQSKEG